MNDLRKTRPLNGLGDAAPMKSEGLGLIEEIVQAAGGVAALLVNVLKKPPSDDWSTFTTYDKNRYVTEALQVSTTAVLTSKSFSVANTFRKFIARVSLNESWTKWQRKNSEFYMSLYMAEDEVKQYRRSGYQPGMQYVNPQIINRVLHPKSHNNATSKAGIYPILIIGGAIGAIAYIYKRKKLKNLKN